MRIAIIGAGGVGGYFGGRLAAAGEDVHFVARGDHLAALRRNGLRLVSPKGDAHVKLVNATPDPIKIGQVDIVLFTVKMYDVDEAASKLAPLLGPSTVVITLQNGVEAVEMVQRHVPRKQIAAGVAYVAAVISEPGVIKHTALETLIFGELDGSPSPRLDKLAAACQRAGFKARVTQTIEQDLWTKFTRLTVFSGMTAVTRSPIGVTREDPDLLEMFRAACQEGINVGRARGVDLPDVAMDEILKMVNTMPMEAKSSMLEDLERGRRLELPWLSGAVVRLGRRAGVPTPLHSFITTILKPFMHGKN